MYTSAQVNHAHRARDGEREKDRQADRQTDRQTERQTDRCTVYIFNKEQVDTCVCVLVCTRHVCALYNSSGRWQGTCQKSRQCLHSGQPLY